jgi:hypothetical protein
MLIVAAVLGILVGGVSGTVMGVVYGFCMASHRDVLAGFKPKTNNKLLLLVCRPTRELGSGATLVLFGLVCLWLVVFVLLVAAPIVTVSKLAGDNSSLTAGSMAVFFLAAFLARTAGQRLWSRLL